MGFYPATVHCTTDEGLIEHLPTAGTIEEALREITARCRVRRPEPSSFLSVLVVGVIPSLCPHSWLMTRARA